MRSDPRVPPARPVRLLTPRVAVVFVVFGGASLPAVLLWRHQPGTGDSLRPTFDDADDATLGALAELGRRAQRNAGELRDLAAELRVGAEDGDWFAPKPAPTPCPKPTPHEPAVATAPILPGEVWLRVAIFSVWREHADYLSPTLDSIVDALPASSPLASTVDIVVVNNQDPPEAHTGVQRAREHFGGRVRIVNKQPPDPPLKCPRRGKLKPQVQRQTCDLVAAIRAIDSLKPTPRYVMLMEDDWLLCPNGMIALQYFIDKARRDPAIPRSRRELESARDPVPRCPSATPSHRHAPRQASRYDPDWIALRVSYGFNGVIVRHADLPSIGEHLASGYERRPPDHLLYEWFSGERPETRRAPARPHAVPVLWSAVPAAMMATTTLMYPDSASSARVTSIHSN